MQVVEFCLSSELCWYPCLCLSGCVAGAGCVDRGWGWGWKSDVRFLGGVVELGVGTWVWWSVVLRNGGFFVLV